MSELRKYINENFNGNIKKFSEYIGENYLKVLRWVNHGVVPNSKTHEAIMERVGFDIYEIIKPKIHHMTEKVMKEYKGVEGLTSTRDFRDFKEYVECVFVDVSHTSRVLGIPCSTLYKIIHGRSKISVEVTTRLLKESNGEINLAMFPNVRCMNSIKNSAMIY